MSKHECVVSHFREGIAYIEGKTYPADSDGVKANPHFFANDKGEVGEEPKSVVEARAAKEKAAADAHKDAEKLQREAEKAAAEAKRKAIAAQKAAQAAANKEQRSRPRARS